MIAQKSKLIQAELLEKLVWISSKKNINFLQVNKLGETPLHLAAKSGSEKMITLLLGLGADTQSTDNEGLRPLNTALEAGNFSVF